MQPNEQTNNEPRTAEDDIAAVNTLDIEQVWLYALTRAVPPGSRIVDDGLVRSKLDLSSADAASVISIVAYCADVITSRSLTPASTLRFLIDRSLEIERATLLVDVATNYSQIAPGASLADIASSLSKLSGTIANMQDALAPSEE